MARGDVVVQQANVVTGAEHTYQPAAGVEVLIRSVFGGTNVSLVDGSFSIGHLDGVIENAVSIVSPGMTTRPGIVDPANVYIFVNNTVRYHSYNNMGATKAMSFSGVQTK